MFVEDDTEYYAQRERAERCLAANALTEAARNAHLALASAYRRKARRIGFDADSAPIFFAQQEPKVTHPT